MPRQLDTEDIVERFRAVHGDRYRYDKVEYHGSQCKVVVICPVHGEFLITPANHSSGRGCPKCAHNAKLDRDAFIAKARAVHGDKYDYSRTVYTKNADKVIIVCPVHGEFVQQANAHLQGHGCPHCRDVSSKQAERKLRSDMQLRDFLKRNYNVGSINELSPEERVDVKSRLAEERRERAEAREVQRRRLAAERKAALSARNAGAIARRVSFDRQTDKRFREPITDTQIDLSVLPDRPYLKNPFKVPELRPKHTILSEITRHYQFNVMYRRECILWCENVRDDPRCRGLSLCEFLYWNRYRYLHKLPAEVTDAELLRAFTISGLLHGYSLFDASLMMDFIGENHIGSVYDPCAGWGERMLACAALGASYYGVDVNDALASGYENMMFDMELADDRFKFVIADSSVYEPKDAALCAAEAVITCPPYGHTEIYSEKGAENLSEKRFIKWWNAVAVWSAKLTGCRYFCVQTNQRCREIFSRGIEAAGFHFVESRDYPVRASHFNKFTKTEYESFLVFERNNG